MRSKLCSSEAWIERQRDGSRLNEHFVTYHYHNGDGYNYTQCFLEATNEPIGIKVRISEEDLFQAHEWCADCRVDGKRTHSPIWIDESTKSFRSCIDITHGRTHKSEIRLPSSPITCVTFEHAVTATGCIWIDIQRGEYRIGESGHTTTARYFFSEIRKRTQKSCALLRKVINGEPLQAEFHPDPSAGRFYRFVFRYRVDPSLALAEDTSIVAGPSNAPWQPNAVSEEDPKKDTVGNNNEINAKGKPVNPRVNTASETEPRHTFNEHQYTTAVTSEPAAEADPIRAAAEPVNEDPFTYHVKIEARTP